MATSDIHIRNWHVLQCSPQGGRGNFPKYLHHAQAVGEFSGVIKGDPSSGYQTSSKSMIILGRFALDNDNASFGLVI